MERGFYSRNVAALFGSLVLHMALVASFIWTTRVPSLGFQFRMPAEVEFGVVTPAKEPTVAAATQGGGQPESAPDDAENTGEGTALTPKRIRKPSPAKPKSAPAETTPDSQAPAVTPTVAAIANADEGAYLALRVDMARVRTSEFAEDVRGLLSAIPDWQMLLRGSDIDPVNDLDRLLIASPNFQRANVVIAGTHPLGRAEVEKIAEKMSGAHGRTAVWQEVNGIAEAPWVADDNVERRLAIVGGKEFVIARNEDIPRVLSVAQVRAARDVDAGTSASSLIDGLLKIDAPSVVELEVEGARRYVMGGQRGIPESVRASIRQPENSDVPVVIKATYESNAAAKDAQDYWSGLRDNYAGLPVVAMLGLSSVLTSVTFDAKGKQLSIRASMTLSQAHIILGYIRSYLESPRARPR